MGLLNLKKEEQVVLDKLFILVIFFYYIYVMGNDINCCSRNKDVEDEENKYYNFKKEKTKIIRLTNDALNLKIEELYELRSQNIIFLLISGTTGIIAIVALCCGATEPVTITTAISCNGTAIYYIYEISRLNSIIDTYKKELERRDFLEIKILNNSLIVQKKQK